MWPVLFHIGAVSVPSFWVAALLGFFVAFLAVRSDVVRRGYDADLAYDMFLYSYVGGWVGARLLLIPGNWAAFRADPIAFLLSSSGWVWYGGLIGGTLAIFLLARQRGLPFILLGDIMALGLAIGQAIGRIGCQLAGDGDYGVPTRLPWGMSYPNGVVPTTDHVHPTPVYELVLYTLIFAYLWRRRRHTDTYGDLLGRYLVLGGAARFAVEFVRRNPAWLLGLTTAQWTSIGLMIVGVALCTRAWISAAPHEIAEPAAAAS